jgi:hypothetical protein
MPLSECTNNNNNDNNTTPLGLSSRLAAAPQGRLPHYTLRTGAGEVGAVRFASRRNDQKDRIHPPLGYHPSPRSTCFRPLRHSLQELCYRLPPGTNFLIVCERKERGLQDLGRNRYRDTSCSWATMVPSDGLRARYLGVGGRRLTTTRCATCDRGRS